MKYNFREAMIYTGNNIRSFLHNETLNALKVLFLLVYVRFLNYLPKKFINFFFIFKFMFQFTIKHVIIQEKYQIILFIFAVITHFKNYMHHI